MKTRLAWLVLIVMAFGGALAYSLSGGTKTPAPKAVDLAPLRAQAALTPCPLGISPALPDLTLACLGGGPAVRLRGAPSGRPTLVNVYGSWCSPCQREMPILRAFHDSTSTVDLVGVDTEDEPRLALQFAHDVGQHWPAVVDDDGIIDRTYGTGPPKTLFVDPAGAIVHVKRGEYKSVQDLRADVLRYLGVKT
jgi:cytochrome c biogenesis protein CcmG/thiol:disulfide interchange protein DsbE